MSAPRYSGVNPPIALGMAIGSCSHQGFAPTRTTTPPSGVSARLCAGLSNCRTKAPNGSFANNVRVSGSRHFCFLATECYKGEVNKEGIFHGHFGRGRRTSPDRASQGQIAGPHLGGYSNFMICTFWQGDAGRSDCSACSISGWRLASNEAGTVPVSEGADVRAFCSKCLVRAHSSECCNFQERLDRDVPN